ncbi:MAG TPA: hypothetical protein VFI41_04965 [Gemmatimonadales bacterium]|nr:hypothetical protein [Gemmatimonadales bacterium]
MGSKASTSAHALNRPPLQRCACGTEWFVVHNCPLNKGAAIAVRPSKPEFLGVARLQQRVRELEQENAELRSTVEDLMLELTETRIALENKTNQYELVLRRAAGE